ncbi:MAG TPA: hypothetical protein VK427_26030, partial [Kofleriaceae bacterium]|nr:hypothetical protein [Kofleriaceae bacterium]
MARVVPALSVAVVFGLAPHAHSGPGASTKITVWVAPPTSAMFGGASYGAFAPLDGAMITERREVEVSLAEPNIAITEQRFVTCWPTRRASNAVGVDAPAPDLSARHQEQLDQDCTFSPR